MTTSIRKYLILQIPWIKPEEMESSGIEGDVTELGQGHEQYTIQPFTASNVKDKKQFDLSSRGGTLYVGLSSNEPCQTVNVCNPDEEQFGIVPRLTCSRCGKHTADNIWITKKEYIRTFLKVEQRWSDEQLNSANICVACRCYIYISVFKQGRRPTASRNAFPRSELATVAAAESVGKRDLKEHEEQEKPVQSTITTSDKKQCASIWPRLRCARCKKSKCGRKLNYMSKVGKKEYITVFLKVEQGWSQEQLKSAKICSACRSFIYCSVFRPDHTSTKSALPRSQLATVAAAESVARQLHADVATRAAAEEVKVETGNGKLCMLFFLLNIFNLWPSSYSVLSKDVKLMFDLQDMFDLESFSIFINLWSEANKINLKILSCVYFFRDSWHKDRE